MSPGGRLQGKTALVTGGASGIGAAIARRFAAEGAAVVVADRDEVSGARVCAEIAAAGGRASFAATDVAIETSAAAACRAAVEAYGGLDVLVNAAAVFVMKDHDASAEDWHRSLAVNVIGTALMTKHAVAHMRERGRGAIVHLGSISSFVAQPRLTTYSATKAAIVQMTRNMAMDLAPLGIRVNCVCPGPIWTPALRRVVADAGLTTEAYLAGECPKILLGRIGEADEVAGPALFLASDDASYVTGATLLVDGGYCAQ